MGKSEPIFKPNKYEKRRDKMEKKSVKFGDLYMKEVVIWIHIYYIHTYDKSTKTKGVPFK